MIQPNCEKRSNSSKSNSALGSITFLLTFFLFRLMEVRFCLVCCLQKAKWTFPVSGYRIEMAKIATLDVQFHLIDQRNSCRRYFCWKIVIEQRNKISLVIKIIILKLINLDYFVGLSSNSSYNDLFFSLQICFYLYVQIIYLYTLARWYNF